MSILVIAPGPLTTVQDLGRLGWRHLGVACAGAMDTRAAELANALVGNPPGTAVLEFTLQGATLQLTEPMRMSVVGAEVDMRFTSAGEEQHVIPSHRPVALPAGVLRVGPLRGGNRTWLAVAGGVTTMPVLGSRSTDLRGGFGGLDGRALAEGDRLPVGATLRTRIRAPSPARWWIAPEHGQSDLDPVRYVPASHPAAKLLARQPWRIHPRSNRQGTRLEGAPLPAGSGNEISAAVAPGTIQLPPDGQPIILLADAQTVGGYPRLGYVIAADLARFAQRRPGTAVHFQPCSRETAFALWRARQAARQRLLHAIRDHLS